MPAITFPNQRVVRIHRERATADFLGIKNENWQAASRNLGAHGLRLYLYLAANANNYSGYGSANSFNTDTWKSDDGKTIEELVAKN